jgi:hypothetical protein
VVEKIIYLRQNYHFGPVKISRYLKRYHDIEVSKSGVWQILKRLDLNRLPASQRHKRHDRKWKRYEKPMPGHAVQVDVKFIAPLSSPSRKKYRGGTSRWLAGKATWYGVWLQHHGHPARRAGLPQLADRRGNYGLQFPVRRHQQPAATPVPAAVIPADPGRT